MKAFLQPLVVLGFAFAAILQAFSQGYIVPNGVTYAGDTPGLGAEIHVLQNPTNADYTGFFLTPQGGSTFLFNPFLDEGVRTFLVSAGDPISLQPIQARRYAELTSPNSYTFALGAPFYLGFYTGYNPWVITNGTGVYTGIYSNPVFGWGQFVNNQGVIQLLNAALEIQGGGIYAGTQTIIPVPEPKSFGMLGSAALLFAWLRRWPGELWKPAPGSRIGVCWLPSACPPRAALSVCHEADQE